MKLYRVIDTDNHGGDFPNEQWQSPCLSEAAAEEVAAIYNRELCRGDYAPRFFRVVPYDYKLLPGFEP